MEQDQHFEQAFAGTRVLGIFRGYGERGTLEVCRRAWDAGVRVVEIPIMEPADLDVLAAAVAAGRERGLDVGAGTILDVDQLEAAMTAGAAFTVAPGFDREVCARAADRGWPHLPGVGTGSEVQAAVAAGYDWLKAFPASVLGADWIRALHGPFPEVRFVATGGMHPGNAREFLAAGCSAVALSSAFDDDASAAEVGAFLHG